MRASYTSKERTVRLCWQHHVLINSGFFALPSSSPAQRNQLLQRQDRYHSYSHSIAFIMEDIDTDSPAVPGTAGLDLDALFAAPPKAQKQMLREAILPMASHHSPELADRICDTIMEKDINELVQL